MGKNITVSTKSISPSQDYLKENTIKFILGCINNDDIGSLPPTPMVRWDEEEDKYIAIDGHNLITVYDFLDKDIEVFVADSNEDYLPNKQNNPAINQRNNDLYEKFDEVIEISHTLRQKGIDSFDKLCKSYTHILTS